MNPATPAPTKKIYLYRMAGGKRIKLCFEVDEHYTILSETAMHEAPVVSAPQPQRPGQPPYREVLERQVAEMRKRGFIVELDPVSGRINTMHVPEHEKLIAGFLEGRPCEFPGSDLLFKQYMKGLEELKAQVANGTCPGCEVGKYKRKYYERLYTILGPKAEALPVPEVRQ